MDEIVKRDLKGGSTLNSVITTKKGHLRKFYELCGEAGGATEEMKLKM